MRPAWLSDDRRGQRLVAVALMLLWLLSLMLPVAFMPDYRGDDAIIHGSQMLALAPFGFMMFQFGWFANMTIPLIAVTFFKWHRPRPRWMTMLGAITLLLFVNSLFWRQVPTDAHSGDIARYLPGYYVWMAAALWAGGWAFACGRGWTGGRA